MSHARTFRRTAATVLCAAAVLAACSDDKSTEMKILAPDAKVGDSSAADLLRDYNRGWVTAPADQNMLVDPSLCDMGRSTDDVYYAPTWGSPGESSASCTMKSGQVLFLQPVGVTCFEDAEEKADDACLDEGFNVTSSSVTVDGEPVENLEDRLVQFEPVDFDLPEDNLMELPAGPTKSIGRGQVVLVDGLSKGEHEVVVKGDFGNGEFAGSITIALTVE